MVLLFGLLIAFGNTKDGGYCGYDVVIDISRLNNLQWFPTNNQYLVFNTLIEKLSMFLIEKLNHQKLLRMLFRLDEVDIEKFQQKPPWNQIQINRGNQSQKP